MADKGTPEGLAKYPRATEDDDVEGHGFRHAATTEPEGLAKYPRATEDDDVEGHSFNLRSPSSRGE